MQALLQRIMRPCTAAFLPPPPPPPPPPSADIKGRRIALNGRYTPEYHTSNSVIPAAYKVAEIQHDYHNSDSEVIISNNNVADSAAMDVRLRGYDGISFANFYKQKQIELFSALDNAFAAKAENALADYDAVKKVDIQLQTRLGTRKGQIAANIIGAFSHSHNYAFGWQVRAYSGESKTKGANAGIFWRRVEGESLYGVNIFGDYEKGEYGEFVRYSIGGELQNAFVSFAANYYVPITDEKSVNSTLVAFSREGYDANLRINIPPLDFLKVAADYYHYDGKYDLAADDGFRYGIEWHPSADLRLGVFYDDGGEEFGGDIVYVYNIAAPAKRESKDAFSPDLFVPILREHSQRVITMAKGPGVSLSLSLSFSTMVATATTQIEAITTEAMTAMTNITSEITTEIMIQIPAITENRASVHATLRIDFRFGGNPVWADIETHIVKHSVPYPDTITRPLVLIVTQGMRINNGNEGRVLRLSPNSPAGRFNVGQNWSIASAVRAYTLTVVQGSEDEFILTTQMATSSVSTSVGISVSVSTTITPQMITPGTSTTTTMTTIATMTTIITLGLTTTETGVMDIDFHLPPSFPHRRESTLRRASSAAKPPVVRWRKAPSAFAALRRVDSRLRGNDEVIDSRRSPRAGAGGNDD